MSWSGSGARVVSPSEHKERKGIDNQIAHEPSWLGTNNRLFLPTGEGAPERVGGWGRDGCGSRGIIPLAV